MKYMQNELGKMIIFLSLLSILYYHNKVHLKSSNFTRTGSETSQNKKLRISVKEVGKNATSNYRLRSRN